MTFILIQNFCHIKYSKENFCMHTSYKYMYIVYTLYSYFRVLKGYDNGI